MRMTPPMPYTRPSHGNALVVEGIGGGISPLLYDESQSKKRSISREIGIVTEEPDRGETSRRECAKIVWQEFFSQVEKVLTGCEYCPSVLPCSIRDNTIIVSYCKVLSLCFCPLPSINIEGCSRSIGEDQITPRPPGRFHLF